MEFDARDHQVTDAIVYRDYMGRFNGRSTNLSIHAGRAIASQVPHRGSPASRTMWKRKM